MKKYLYSGIILAAFGFLFQSCQIDDSYNLGNIDSEITFGEGTEFPLPQEDLPEIKIKDFIVGDNSSTSLSIVGGDYYIDFSIPEAASFDGFSIDASSFQLNVSDSYQNTIALSPATIPANTPLEYAAADKSALQAYFTAQGYNVDLEYFDNYLSQEYDFGFDVDFSIASFPTQIKGFRSADLDGTFTLSFKPSGIPFSKFSLKQNSVISFPSFIKFSSCNNSAFTLTDGNKLVANQDVIIPLDGNGLTLVLQLSGLDKGEEIPTAGSLALIDAVSVDGTIAIDPADFTGATTLFDLSFFGGSSARVVAGDINLSAFAIKCDYSASNVLLKNATIKIDAQNAIPEFATSYGFDIEGLPDMIGGDGADIAFSLSSFQVILGLDSQLPFDLSLNAKLSSARKGETTHTFPLGPLTFPAATKTVYSIGDHADGSDENFVYKNVPGIGSILNPIPDRVQASDFQLSIDDSKYVTVESGVNYGGSLDIGVLAPFALTADSHVALSVDVDDVDVNIGEEISLDELGVKLNVENTIPLNFEIQVTALDKDRNEIVKATMNPIAGGWTGHPVSTVVAVTLKLGKNSAPIKKLDLKLNAYSDETIAGKPFNDSQSLKFVKGVVIVPKGITTNLPF